jgi:hypothetical protein
MSHGSLIENSAIGTATEKPAGAATGRGVRGQRAISPWTWAILASVLLITSGGLRNWRDHRFAVLAKSNQDCPFPLNSLPRTLGTWTEAGTETQLDAQIARVAGSSEHVIRTYKDTESGTEVKVLILYGLARSVFGHTPEICYPSAGFQPASELVDRKIAIPNQNEPAIFRSAVYRKTSTGQTEESYYSFRHNGDWLPEMGDRWKLFRYVPGMFKIQVQRIVSAGAIRSSQSQPSPVEPFLAALVKVIEDKVKLAEGAESSRG